MRKCIYLGLGAHVVCLDVTSGSEWWRTKLANENPLTLVVVDELVIAYAGGSAFGLSRMDGRILWQNKLPGLGYGRCIIATEKYLFAAVNYPKNLVKRTMR